MPIIRHEQAPLSEPFPGMHSRAVVSADTPAVAVTLGDVTLDPGGGVPLHIHPNHEEAIVVLEGTVEFVMDQERVTVGAGTTALAPAGVLHAMRNAGQTPARVLTFFPTVNVRRVFAEST